jgi:Protein of unknown function (DUF4011)
MAEGDQTLDRRLQEWSERLIDLSRRNRLLYSRPSKRSTLLITQPDTSVVFDRLAVQEKAWQFWLPPVQNTTVQLAATNSVGYGELVCSAPNREDLERTLANLYRRANTDYQERGVRTLQVVFGFLVWKETNSSEIIHSPLILCPAILSRETARDPL